MAPLPVISLVFLKVSTRRGYLILHLHLDLHSPPEISFHWSRASVDFPSPLVNVYNLFLNSSLCCVYAMPYERGKPKHGSVLLQFCSFDTGVQARPWPPLCILTLLASLSTLPTLIKIGMMMLSSPSII
jgi:hypothetical protein